MTNQRKDPTMTELWNDLPRLAVGTHDAASGKGCIMNVISRANGDVTITDMPACTHPVLARAAQRLNDTICTHRDGDLLCVDCSTIMYGYEPRLVGTSPPADELEAKRLAVGLAVALRPIVEPLWRAQDRAVCATAFDAAAAWWACPCEEHAANAGNAGNAYAAHAAAAAYAANAANADAAAAAWRRRALRTGMPTAAYAAACAAACGADADTAAAYATRDPKLVLDTLLDAYDRLTGRHTPTPTPEHWTQIRTHLADMVA